MVATRRLERLRSDLEARLDPPPPPLVVALSGGADSAALAGLANPRRLLHVHHGQAHSDGMEKAARSIAKSLALPLVVLRASVEPWSETRARQVRYRLLLEALEPGETLLTGHTADDQVETVLANILRGTGPTGLRGIPPRRDRIARPLLAITRAETREFATLAGLPWQDDLSNDDVDPLRNRIRHRLLPTLEAEYNPSVRAALLNLADLFSQPDNPEPIGEEFADGMRFANSVLWAVGAPATAHVLREALRPWRGGYGLERAETERVWEVVSGQRARTELAGGIEVVRSGPWLVVRSLPLRLSDKS